MNNLNMRTMRLTVLILVLVFCGTTLFAGGAKENPKAGPVALRWMMQAGTPTEVEQWKELAADVTKKYPNITVTLETTDFSSYWTKLPAEIASGTTADILYMQSLRTKGFAEKAARPMNDYINADKELDYKDFVEAIMNGLSVDGKIYGLPYDIGPYMLFYNADLFDRYGVPYPDDKMDWRGFLDRARKLTRNGNYGYAISTHFDRSIPFIWGNGGGILRQEWTLQYHGSENYRSFEILPWSSGDRKSRATHSRHRKRESRPGDVLFRKGRYVYGWSLEYYQHKTIREIQGGGRADGDRS